VVEVEAEGCEGSLRVEMFWMEQGERGLIDDLCTIQHEHERKITMERGRRGLPPMLFKLKEERESTRRWCFRMRVFNKRRTNGFFSARRKASFINFPFETIVYSRNSKEWQERKVKTSQKKRSNYVSPNTSNPLGREKKSIGIENVENSTHKMTRNM